MLVVYDLTQKESFEGVRFWINEVSDKAEEEVAIVMTANKCDLIDKRALSLNDGEEFAKVPSNFNSQKHDISFGKTSAKTGEGVDEIFDVLLEAIGKGKEIVTKKGENLDRNIGG